LARFGPLNWRARRVGLQQVGGLEIPTRPALFLVGLACFDIPTPNHHYFATKDEILIGKVFWHVFSQQE